MKTKKLLALLLTLVMVCSLLPSLALADGDEAPGGETNYNGLAINQPLGAGSLDYVTVSDVTVNSAMVLSGNLTDGFTLDIELSPDTAKGSVAQLQFDLTQTNGLPCICSKNKDTLGPSKIGGQAKQENGRYSITIESLEEANTLRLYLFQVKMDYQGSGITFDVNVTVARNTTEIEPGGKSIVSLSVDHEADRSRYHVGERFYPAGLTIRANYSDGTQSEPFNDFTWAPDGALTEDDEAVTLSYEGFTLSYPIAVVRKNELIDAEILDGEGAFIYKPYLFNEDPYPDRSNTMTEEQIKFASRIRTGEIVTLYGAETVRIELTLPTADTGVYIGETLQNPGGASETCVLTIPASGKTQIVLRREGEEDLDYTFKCYAQKYDDLPDAVVDYLCINSQYTNLGNSYNPYVGINAVATLIGGGGDSVQNGSLSSTPYSLGNFGGYITYYYAEPIRNDPRNPYGIDFIIAGNSYLPNSNYYEPGAVMVSEDNETWYVLAASTYYDDYTYWDYSATYSPDADGYTQVTADNGRGKVESYSTHRSFPAREKYPLFDWDSVENDTITLRGPMPSYGMGYWGYADRGVHNNTNLPDNPYLAQDIISGETDQTDGFDLAWAVDAAGQPVRVNDMEFHYVKVQTAWNIENSATGEKSAEINMMRLTQPRETAVGQSGAPEAITVDGVTIAMPQNGEAVEATVSGPFAVHVNASGSANVFINGERSAAAQYDAMPYHRMLRIVVQEGEKEPWIGYVNLRESEEAGDVHTLNFDAGTNGLVGWTFWRATVASPLDGEQYLSKHYDEMLNGEDLPIPWAPGTTPMAGQGEESITRDFIGWQYGQRLFTKYDHALLPDGATLTAVYQNRKTGSSPKPTDKITVSFRLIGSSKSEADINLADGDYHGAEYQTWIGTTNYALPEGSTVLDLVDMALGRAGLSYSNPSGNYIEGVTAPEWLGGREMRECTNGPRSGWMYTVNGTHANNSVIQQVLDDGDRVILHYVDDYAYEVSDWDKLGGGAYPALGDGTYWDAWLAAPDLNPDDPSYSGGVPSGSEKKEKKETSSSETTSDKNTVTADDGSAVTTETEKTVETKENDDGSVTETVTETTTTTITAPDGSTSVTETAVETETTTNSVKNADGTVTETEQTVEKVTETVTGADGTKQIVVTETEETKEIKTATGADGKVSGTGTYSAKSTVTGEDGKKAIAVTEGSVVVDTDDKGTVSEVTTAKTTTTAPDGTKTETVTVITEAEMANGTTGKVVADEQGNTISAEATVSKAALEAAAKGDGVIEIPVTVNAAGGATVRISLEGKTGDGKAWVEIGTTETAPCNVAYLKLADGVTKLLTTCKTGSVIVPVTGDCEVIVKDNSKRFADVEAGAWYGDSVKFVTAREIFNGTGDGTFAPGATMNRAMAAQILYNLDGEAKAGDGSRFSDVSAGDWFNGAVGWAAGLGVINGYDGAYAPLNAVTRQDLVTILYRYAKQAGFDVSAGRSVDLSAYADGAAVASYAADAMRWAIAVGLIKGYEDNTLRPTATATRAEVAAIMQRMVQNAVK